MNVVIHLELPEAEAINLARGAPSERIQSTARKAIIHAREDAKLSERLIFAERSDGAYEIKDCDKIVGIARRYHRYWQIYMRESQENIRRTTWPLLKAAIEQRVKDRDHVHLQSE